MTNGKDNKDGNADLSLWAGFIASFVAVESFERRTRLELYTDAANNDNDPENAMQVTFDLPEEIVRYLGHDAQTLSRAALEALALEGIRAGKLSTAQARRVLGFRTRQQMDAFLQSRGVHLPLTIEQVRRDSETALAFSSLPRA
jgi:hypothetical protein